MLLVRCLIGKPLRVATFRSTPSTAPASVCAAVAVLVLAGVVLAQIQGSLHGQGSHYDHFRGGAMELDQVPTV